MEEDEKVEEEKNIPNNELKSVDGSSSIIPGDI